MNNALFYVIILVFFWIFPFGNMHIEANVSMVTDVTVDNTPTTLPSDVASTTLPITLATSNQIATTITIEPNKLIIPVGYVGVARVTVYDQTNTLMSDTTVAGLSSSTSVATVDSSRSTDINGQAYFYVYGISVGNTTITFYAGSMSNSIPVTVANVILPSSLTLDKTALSVAVNKTGTITATLLDQNKAPVSNIAIQASSNNTNIATVDSSKTTNAYGSAAFGIIGKSIGNIVVTFTSGVVSATSTVSVVSERKATSMSVEPSELSIPANYSNIATVKIFDQDSSPMSDTIVTAVSNYTSVATVNGSQTTNTDGIAYFTVNGVSIGSATINFSADNISKLIPVSVLNVIPSSLIVDKNKLSVLAGEKGTVTATLSGQDNSPISNININASSGNTSTTTVSPSAKATDNSGNASFEITGKSEGSTKVYFRVGTLTASTSVSVVLKSVATTMNITPVELEIPINYTGTATVTVLDQYKSPMSGINVNASSDYTSIATVVDGSQTTNIDGQALFAIYGISKGSAIINFTASGITNSMPVSVMDIDLIPSRIVLSDNKLKLSQCESAAVIVKVLDKISTPIPQIMVIPSVKQKELENPHAEITPSGTLTDANGDATFSVTGLRKGNVTINFDANGISDKLKVSIKDTRIVSLGTEKTITITVYQNGQPKSGVSIIAESSDTDVVIVEKNETTDSNGEAKFKITGVGEGTAIITFTTSSGSVLLENIMVIKTALVEVSENNLSISVGSNQNITVTATDVNKDPITNTNVYATIKSGGKNIEVTPYEQTTDENGSASFTITGVNDGKAQVEFGVCGLSEKVKIEVYQ